MSLTVKIKYAEVGKLKYDNATVSVPGSKSYSLRALFISAMCNTPSQINNLLESEDTTAMQKSLNDLKAGKSDIFVQESGITARFITALACITPGEQVISGEPSLNNRPIKGLVAALTHLGADIEYLEKEGFPPIKINSQVLSGGELTISGAISSQYLSALLLIGPLLKNGLTVNISGKQISKPYIDMTIEAMSQFSVKVKNENYKKYIVPNTTYVSKRYKVESDYSSASYFYAINALNQTHIKVNNIDPESKQADRNFVQFISEFDFNPTEINVEDFPDQAMTLAVLLAFVPGKSVLRGVKSLRLKETERVKAVENELAKMGIKSSSTTDLLTIYGGYPQAATIDTYGDHRIAMSFAVAATKLKDLKILKPEVVNKTFPGFWDELSKIADVSLKEIELNNILLTGMRGTGKSTTGKYLARELGYDYIDMDKYIERDTGIKIRDMIINKGWDYFRDAESKACKKLAKLENTVIASGGGIVLNKNNMTALKETSFNVLLLGNPKILSRRIRFNKHRLELTSQPTMLGELSEVWDERKDHYFKYADFTVDTDHKNPKQVAREILDKINR